MENQHNFHSNYKTEEKRKNENLNLEKILDIEKDVDIEGFDEIKSFFSKVKFKDKRLEEIFQQEKDGQVKLNDVSGKNLNFTIDIFIDSVFIFGYIVSLLYLLIAYYNLSLILICIIFKIISSFLIFISIKTKKNNSQNRKKIVYFLDHALIFLSSFNLNLKVFLINVLFIEQNNDYSDELIRVIIYQYLSTNIFLIVKLEADFKIFFFYFAKDLIFILLSEIFSQRRHFYYLEGLTSLSTYLVFYIFRKIWDFRIRIIFIEKFKFYNFYIYVNDLLNGINGHHINIFDKNIISFNNKFSCFMDEKLNEVKIYKKFKEFLFSNRNQLTKIHEESFLKIKINTEISRENPGYFNEFKDIVNQLESENKLFFVNGKEKDENNYETDEILEILNLNIFLKSFILYDINTRKIDEGKSFDTCSKSTDYNEIMASKTEEELKNENLILNDFFLFDILKKNIESDTINEESTFDFEENKIDSLGIFNLKINNDYIKEIINLIKIPKEKIKHNDIISVYDDTKDRKYEELFQKRVDFNDDSKDYIIKIEKSYTGTDFPKLNEKEINQSFLKPKFLEYKKTFEKKNYKSDVEDKYSKKIKNEKSIKNPEKCEKSREIYHEIFIRRVKLSNSRVIYNLIFYDVTELVISKNKILKEEFQKTRLFAKIAHEFKTPLNSILSILDKINQENNINNKTSTTPKNLESISPMIFSKEISNRSYVKKKTNIEDIKQLVVNSHNFQFYLNKENLINSSFAKNKKNKNENISLAFNLLNTINFLVSDIITLSKFDDMNQIKIRDDYLNVKEIVFGMKKILDTLLYLSKSKQKKIKSDVVISESIDFDLENQIFYKSDMFRIKQILYNLISNAVKFTNVGKIIINVKNFYFTKELNDKEYFSNTNRTENKKNLVYQFSKIKSSELKEKSNFKKGKYLRISIKDTGQGIDEEKQKKIFNTDFEEYYKTNQIDDIFKINGFGLMICKKLADFLNIEIGFQSEVNKGSDFFILIPELDKSIHENQRQKSNGFKVHPISENINRLNLVYKEFNEASSHSKINEIKNSVISIKHSPQKSYNQLNLNEINNSNMHQTKRISNSIKFDCSSLRLNCKFDCTSENTVTERFQNILRLKNNKNSYSKIKKILTNRNTNSMGFRLFHFEMRSKLNNSYDVSRNNFDQVKFEDSIFDSENYSKIQPKKDRVKNKNELNLCESLNYFKNAAHHKKYILVVDDNHLINDVNRNIVDICFKQSLLCYEILQCNDGVDIIRHILNENINKNIILILTDENMEYFNGSEAIRFLRELERKQIINKIPCISVTSHEDKIIIDRIIECGADFVISKPLTKTDFMNAIINLKVVKI